MKELIGKYILGDTTIFYVLELGTQTAGIIMLPNVLTDKFTLTGMWQVDSLVQIKAIGDNNPIGFSHGHSMRNSGTTQALKYQQQKVEKEEERTKIITVLASDKLEAVHTLEYKRGTEYFKILTEIRNISKKELTIEMLSSYSVCGFSPIEEAERMEDFNLYRLQSKWSAEGRLQKQNFTELQLEPSWQKYGVQSVRFGQVGSMPVRRYFPWIGIEDKKYGYFLGAQLYYAGSWQMELYTKDDRAAMSGGLADREFGHWMKILKPGEELKAPKAVLASCTGNVDDLAYRLTRAQQEGLDDLPESEKDLPVLFNEFCTTWGNPTKDNLLKIVEAVKGKGFRYCVIDAGWYSIGADDWNGDMGDWKINQDRFPGGFTETVEAIKRAGMIPGLWFEMECVGCNTQGFHKEEWQLKRDGFIIQTGMRRFWDMRNPQVIEFLAEKVIGILKQYHFGYLKVDYNDNIGIGCDGAESMGEGLRQYVEGSQIFFQKIREELPDIVIENCSSGGHRLEPSMMALSQMASFSDAHECISIPIIAANVQRAILPRQSQIWAVLRATDSDKRLFYSMISTLLGRMCLSGDIYDLNKEQWKIVEDGIDIYEKSKDIIREGISYRFGDDVGNYNRPKGWQAVMRHKIASQDDEKEGRILVIIHNFMGEKKQSEPCKVDFENRLSEAARKITMKIPKGSWKVENCYARKTIDISIEGERLILEGFEDFEAAAVLLTME
ncbi:glycoside hydrolase family 36 protein [Kineothrix sp. MB12-C1]|uniref:glycoside hydrolase family 36 protein n=1 Tax=Kineothrix sp. MB12-C1 TaxID=3070215 RepID=UPI0027D1FC34|nr:glycoside hydrolase family 36 protein [Kineothrix sp. MB12-C1]WMC91945.1 alpha-galactosidase [Kineothrix sp. MB12-C1]